MVRSCPSGHSGDKVTCDELVKNLQPKLQFLMDYC